MISSLQLWAWCTRTHPWLRRSFSRTPPTLIFHTLTFCYPKCDWLGSPSASVSDLRKDSIACSSPGSGNNSGLACCSLAIRASVGSESSSIYIERFVESRIEGCQGWSKFQWRMNAESKFREHKWSIPDSLVDGYEKILRSVGKAGKNLEASEAPYPLAEALSFHTSLNVLPCNSPRQCQRVRHFHMILGLESCLGIQGKLDNYWSRPCVSHSFGPDKPG